MKALTFQMYKKIYHKLELRIKAKQQGIAITVTYVKTRLKREFSGYKFPLRPKRGWTVTVAEIARRNNKTKLQDGI